jgi:N-acetylgalactosamine-6-sulfatase
MTSRWPASFATYPANGGFGDRVTVTQLLRQAGYRTGHFGKWHIGPDTRPGTYGIDQIDVGGGDKRDTRGRDAAIYDQAIRFIEAHKDHPFYVNVWGHISHHAVNPREPYALRFKDVQVSEADFPPPMREKFAVVKARGGDPSQAMRNYLGDVSSLDDDIGRLLQRLDELGLSDNTLVVFSSDHGSPAIPEAPKDKKKRDKNNAGDPADTARFDLSLNLMGFNGGLRGGKHGMYEGGVRVPFIVRWPARVPAGRVDSHSVISGIDWLPTLCAVAGVKINAADFEGENVLPAWLGKTVHTRSKPLLWKTSSVGSEAGILEGSWKLIAPTRKRGEVELYNLASDPGESTNLAVQHPEIVSKLSGKLESWVATLPKEYVKTDDKDN